ncbi:MAG: DUF1700 domain-containing protein [Acidobacteria bacterium]|nr:DUF1700 domain-containing protein [Acidobacteriota bacterium]
MNRESFLEALKKNLKGIPETEVSEIIEDYRMHFREGRAEGRDEADIARGLGDPAEIGRMFRADFMVTKAGKSATLKNVAGAAMAVVGLGIFNLIFVAGPVLAVFLALFTIWIMIAVLAMVSLAVIVASVFYALFPSYFLIGGTSPFLLASGVFFLGIGTLSLSALFSIAMGILTRFCFRLLTGYLKFNLELIQKRRTQ